MADRSVFAAAGKRGAAKRWGPPRLLHVGDLSPDQRRLVLAFVEMARAADLHKETTPTGENVGAVNAEVTRGRVDSPA